MPVTTVGSWITTIDEFLQSWADVDAALTPDLVLLGGYSRASLVADRATLEAAITDIQAKENVTESARGDRDIKLANLRPRFAQFRATVNGLLPGSRYIVSIPQMPRFDDKPGVWRERIDELTNLWTVINANNPAVPGFTPPLILAGGYSILSWTGESNTLKTAFATLRNAEQAEQLARELRDDLFEPVYQRLRQYRQAVQGAFPATSPIVLSLPRLRPKQKPRKKQTESLEDGH